MGSSSSKAEKVHETVKEIKASDLSPAEKASRIYARALEHKEARDALFRPSSAQEETMPFMIRAFPNDDPRSGGSFVAGYSTLDECIRRCDYENDVDGAPNAAASLFGADYASHFTFKIYGGGQVYVWQRKGVAVPAAS